MLVECPWKVLYMSLVSTAFYTEATVSIGLKKIPRVGTSIIVGCQGIAQWVGLVLKLKGIAQWVGLVLGSPKLVTLRLRLVSIFYLLKVSLDWK